MLCCPGSKWKPVDGVCHVELCPDTFPHPAAFALCWEMSQGRACVCVCWWTSLLSSMIQSFVLYSQVCLPGTQCCLLRCPKSVQTIDNTHIHRHAHTNKHDEHSHVHQAFGSRAVWQPASECVKHKPSLIFHHLETNPFGKQWQATVVCFVPSELLIMLCLKSVQRVLMRKSEMRN